MCQYILQSVLADANSLSVSTLPFRDSYTHMLPTSDLTTKFTSLLEKSTKIVHNVYPVSRDRIWTMLALFLTIVLGNGHRVRRRSRAFPSHDSETHWMLSNQFYMRMDFSLEKVCEHMMHKDHFKVVSQICCISLNWTNSVRRFTRTRKELPNF